MMSRTGIKGFTLIEVMAATCVLALGTVFVHQAYLRALDTFGYYENSLNVGWWLDEKIWEAQENLSETGSLGDISTSGEFTLKNKRFSWNISASPQDEAKGKYDLFKIGLSVNWQEGSRSVAISRNAYALHEK